MRDDELSEATWKEVSDWLRMRGLLLRLTLQQGSYFAEVEPTGAKPARWQLCTGDSAAEAISRVLKKCRDAGCATLIEQGVRR